MNAERAKNSKRSKPQTCFDGVPVQELQLDRVVQALHAAGRLDAYLALHDDLVQRASKDPACAPQVRSLLVERAFAAEADMRLLCRESLGVLNDLRDTGELDRLVREGAKAAAADGLQIEDTLREAQDELHKRYPGHDFSPLERLAAVAGRYEFADVKATSGTLESRVRNESGDWETFRVRGDARPGDTGRVSAQDFLVGHAVTPVLPTWVPPSCHHRRQFPGVTPHKEPIPIYTAAVAELAMAREAMYRHARTMEEVGPASLRGRDPVTAVVVALVIVGIVLVGVGVVVGGKLGALIAAAGILILGALCVASGYCTFVVSFLLLIVA